MAHSTLHCDEISGAGEYVRRELRLVDDRGTMRFTTWGGSEQLGSYGGDTWPHEHPAMFSPLPSSALEGSGRVRLADWALKVVNSLAAGEQVQPA